MIFSLTVGKKYRIIGQNNAQLKSGKNDRIDGKLIKFKMRVFSPNAPFQGFEVVITWLKILIDDSMLVW